GPWTIVGENAAYFVGWCPACGYGTVSLTVTLDGGRHFRPYKIPQLDGFRATSVRVAGDDVTVAARSNLQTGPRGRTVTVEVDSSRRAYSTRANGQSESSHALTARQSGASSAAWLARTHECARAPGSPSRSG